MISKFRSAIRDESGQGMTEYIIIVALIAIAAIGVVTLFGDNIRALFGASADALQGDTNRGTKKTKKASAYEKAKNLSDFGKNNKGGF
ncbi:MAG: Flp family type IVb pilin [Deltaproteobacteria bacterium]|nr:MAG: Flp family type IVb pilin [Deltaproteobacteria bacterium]